MEIEASLRAEILMLHSEGQACPPHIDQVIWLKALSERNSAKAERVAINLEDYQPTKAELKVLYPDAIATIRDILQNSDKDNVKLQAAQFVIEQNTGKANQNVQVSGSLLADIIHRLDRSPSDPLEATPLQVLASLDPLLETFVNANLIDVIQVGQRGKSGEGSEQES